MSSEIKGYEFGEFILDCEEQALLRGGEPVALTPKAYLLLRTLLENQGRIMPKAELMEKVWPDSFVEEGNLSFTTHSLRKILGDSKDQPRFIETVPRRGYRFVAEVRPLAVETPPTEEPKPAPAGAETAPVTAERAETAVSGGAVDGPPRSVGRAVAVAGAAAVLAAISLGIWFALGAGKRSSVPILSRQFSVEQLSTSGNSARVAVSPDGKFVVYTDEGGGKQSVWMRNVDTAETVQIIPPSEDEYLGLTYSHDGGSIYFVRMPAGMHGLPALYRIGTMGGVPVKLADNVNKRVSVSPDDSHIALSQCRFRTGDFCTVVVIDTNGENARKVMTTADGYHIYDLAFSPDGAAIAVAAGRSYNEMNDSLVYEVNAETGEQREMFPERFAEVSSLEWVPDGSGLLVAASDFQDGKCTIYLADRKTGKLEQVTRDAASYATLTLNRTADRMTAVQQIPDYRINVMSPGAAAATKLGVARDLAAMPGGRLVYATFDGELWSVNRDGSEQRQLTKSRHAETSVCPSPDGKTIFFSTDESGRREVWRMNADGTDRKQLTTEAGGYPMSVSLDGRYVYYESTTASRIRRISADGSEDVQLHDKLLSNPAVSPDGAHVAYFFTESMVRKLAIMDLGTKENVRVLDAPPGAVFVRPLAWSGDGKALHYITNSEGRNTVWRLTPDNGAPQKTADIGDGHVLDLTVADDGNLAYTIGGWRYDVMLIRGLA